MRRLLKILGAVVGVVFVGALLVLLQAHWEIRSIHPTLPDSAEIDAALASDDTPVRIGYVLTAEQSTPERRIGHPVFLLEWRDGRMLSIDAGMTRDGAVSFGKPFELIGGQPSVAYGSVGEQLGDRAAAVGAVVFTHLHVDHTGGIGSLCAGNTRGITVFQTPLQADRVNYLTRGGKRDIEAAACAKPARLDGGPIYYDSRLPGHRRGGGRRPHAVQHDVLRQGRRRHVGVRRRHSVLETGHHRESTQTVGLQLSGGPRVA